MVYFLEDRMHLFFSPESIRWHPNVVLSLLKHPQGLGCFLLPQTLPNCAYLSPLKRNFEGHLETPPNSWRCSSFCHRGEKFARLAQIQIPISSQVMDQSCSCAGWKMFGRMEVERRGWMLSFLLVSIVSGNWPS